VFESDSIEVVLVGIGSPHGDDQIGWYLADEFTRLRPTFRVKRLASPIEVLDELDGVERLIVCDGCRTGSPPGRLARFHWPDGLLASTLFSGTHDLGLAAVLQLGATLGTLPDAVTVFGVEIGSARPGSQLSPEISRALPSIARSIDAELLSI
jgi:hydrogenase maturation protease